MAEKKIRNLRPEEIECRVGSITERWVTLLLYKNARVDQAILDEVFGIYGWQRKHEKIGDGLYCTVSIWDEDKRQWVEKEDVGTESEYEKAKGAASDSFKRACFNLGIGRELYTAPFICLSRNRVQIEGKNGKNCVKDSFSVKEIATTEDKVITDLTIINQKKEEIYTYHAGKKDAPLFTEEEMRLLYQELERTGVSEQVLFKRYQINSMEEMDRDTYDRALRALKRSKKAA